MNSRSLNSLVTDIALNSREFHRILFRDQEIWKLEDAGLLLNCLCMVEIARNSLGLVEMVGCVRERCILYEIVLFLHYETICE